MRKLSDPVGAVTRRAAPIRWRAIDAIAQVHRRVSDGSVALTFDDGPRPGSTDLVLDILAELGVSATFFCVGKNVLAYPDLARRIRASGHAVGSHSFTHPDPEKTALPALARDYVRGRQALVEVLGEDTGLFRPPRGHLNVASAALVRRLGLRPWLWSLNPEDWRAGAVQVDIEASAGQATAGDVVLLHDWIEQPWAPEALNRSATIDALVEIVSQVRERGLTFRSLTR
jgi:peptidoglycan/xylan/chitin deacetylase (PgdA/CDA1 family)